MRGRVPRFSHSLAPIYIEAQSDAQMNHNLIACFFRCVNGACHGRVFVGAALVREPIAVALRHGVSAMGRASRQCLVVRPLPFGRAG